MFDILQFILTLVCAVYTYHLEFDFNETKESPLYVEGQVKPVVTIATILVSVNLGSWLLQHFGSYNGTVIPSIALAGFLLVVVGYRTERSGKCTIADTFNIILSLSTIITSIWL